MKKINRKRKSKHSKIEKNKSSYYKSEGLKYQKEVHKNKY